MARIYNIKMHNDGGNRGTVLAFHETQEPSLCVYLLENTPNRNINFLQISKNF